MYTNLSEWFIIWFRLAPSTYAYAQYLTFSHLYWGRTLLSVQYILLSSAFELQKSFRQMIELRSILFWHEVEWSSIFVWKQWKYTKEKQTKQNSDGQHKKPKSIPVFHRREIIDFQYTCLIKCFFISFLCTPMFMAAPIYRYWTATTLLTSRL